MSPEEKGPPMTTPAAQQELGAYADVIVHVGLNLQPGQRLLIRADVHSAPLVRAVARSAYGAGSPFVDVIWGDEQLALARLQRAPAGSFGEIAAWQPPVVVEHLQSGGALLSIRGDTPGLLGGEDPEAISTMMRASAQAHQPVGELVQRNASNWAVIAYPSPGWAAKVFPELPPDEAVARLWQAIGASCRLDTADPVAAWKAHLAELDARCAYMNSKAYSALHYRGPGTDFTLGLPKGHIWAGGASTTERGQLFVANLPTEEIFSLPDRARADGVVRASRPLNYGGTLISDFSLHFAGGRVTQIEAASGEAVLRRLVETDEGAARLGEVALVPDSSPISRTGLLFANTLFDENAASHLALGNGYRFCLQGGAGMSREAFEAAGGNLSAAHVDFMIGSGQLEIDGIAEDGSAEPVMRAGEWAFSV
jgi:aminopeptidase